MKRVLVAATMAVILALATGCLNPVAPIVPPTPVVDDEPLLRIEREFYGWVEITLRTGFGTIHWGDSFEDDAYAVALGPGVFAHYYGTPGVYAMRLLDGLTEIETLAVSVREVRGHLELVAVNGQAVMVRHQAADENYQVVTGLVDTIYVIEWGDGQGTTISANEYYALGNERSHRYRVPGVYTISMRSSKHPLTPYFTVTVTQDS